MLLTFGCSKPPPPPSPPTGPPIIERPEPEPPRTLTAKWAATSLTTVKASADDFTGSLSIPDFGDIRFGYHNPHTQVDMSTWQANKAPVFRGAFNPPNPEISYLRLAANAGKPFETFWLQFSKPITDLTFPLYDFDESGATITFTTPDLDGSQVSERSFENESGGRWTLEGASLTYEGQTFKGNEHLQVNIVVITIHNPKGFTAVQIQPETAVGVGIGELEFTASP